MLKLFKINKTGVSELMKSGEMQAILSGKAKEIASRCGSGYGTDIYWENKGKCFCWSNNKESKKR